MIPAHSRSPELRFSFLGGDSSMRIKVLAISALVVLAVVGATPCMAQAAGGQASQTAEEAFIYGFPMVMNYAVFNEYFIDKSNPEYKTPFNQLYNTARV